MLAEEYGIRHWISALLDPEPIAHGTSDPKKDIKSPPPYRKKKLMNGTTSKTPSKASDGRRSTRGDRSVRSESPTKKTPARKIATPRKARKGRGTKSPEPADAVKGEEDSVKVEIDHESKPSADGEEEIEHTKINISMPTGHPDLELPDDAEGMLSKARDMVAEAEKISGPSTVKGKRKAADVLDDGELGSLAPVKRVKTVELELRKERLKRRALTGIAASLAIGYALPTLRSFDFR